MKCAALSLAAAMLVATATQAADAPAQATAACATTTPTINDLRDDATVLRGLYGATQTLREARVSVVPATFVAAATSESGSEEFRVLRERRAVLRDGQAAWLLILESVPVKRDAEGLRLNDCPDCRRRGYALLLQACAGGWQPQGPAQTLATGGSSAAPSSYRFLDLSRERVGIVQQWAEYGGWRSQRELQTLFALHPSGKATRVLDLLRRLKDNIYECGMDASSDKDAPPPICRDTLNRIEATDDATAEWRPLRIGNRFLDEHGRTRETFYRLVFRDGRYQPEIGELAPRLRPDFAPSRRKNP